MQPRPVSANRLRNLEQENPIDVVPVWRLDRWGPVRDRSAAEATAQSRAQRGLHGPPHPAAFADHTTLASPNRRDFLQNL